MANEVQKTKFSIKQVTGKIKKMPTWGKFLLALGACLFIYLIFKGRKQVAAERMAAPPQEAINPNYDSLQPTENNGNSNNSNNDGSGGGGGGGGVSEGSVSYDDLQYIYDALNGQIKNTHEEQQIWNSQLSETMTGLSGLIDTVTVPNGLKQQSTIIELSEGNHNYKNVNGNIYKDGNLVPLYNYQYIPSEIGGTRTTGSGLGETNVNGSSHNNNKNSDSSSHNNNQNVNGSHQEFYKEGSHVYVNNGGNIYKDGNLVPESNYKYIPGEVGGTRK